MPNLQRGRGGMPQFCSLFYAILQSMAQLPPPPLKYAPVHRTLKVALRCQSNPTNCYRHLGLVLLGMRAAMKEDLGYSSAEMTLGTQLRLPGQFFVEEKGASQTEYRKQLSEFMATLRPKPPRECTNQQAYVDRKLKLCTHVFIKTMPLNRL